MTGRKGAPKKRRYRLHSGDEGRIPRRAWATAGWRHLRFGYSDFGLLGVAETADFESEISGNPNLRSAFTPGLCLRLALPVCVFWERKRGSIVTRYRSATVADSHGLPRAGEEGKRTAPCVHRTSPASIRQIGGSVWSGIRALSRHLRNDRVEQMRNCGPLAERRGRRLSAAGAALTWRTCPNPHPIPPRSVVRCRWPGRRRFKWPMVAAGGSPSN